MKAITMRPVSASLALGAGMMLFVGVASAQPANGTRAGSGDNNQAVATTTADAMAPAHGSNSFSRGEAMRRIRSRGFDHVAGLKQDEQGVWRGTASRNGGQVHVWLDYKGNVGTQPS